MQALLVWNCRNPFLADPRVRRALTRAWPREEMVRAALSSGRRDPRRGPLSAGRPGESAGPRTAVLRSGRVRAAPRRGGLEAPGRTESAARTGSPRRSRCCIRRARRSTPPSARSCARLTRRSGSSCVLRPLDWAAFTQRAQKGEFDVQFAGNVFLPPNIDPYPYYPLEPVAAVGRERRLLQEPRGGSADGGRADRARSRRSGSTSIARSRSAGRGSARPTSSGAPISTGPWRSESRTSQISPIGLFHFLPGPLGWRPAPAPSR